MSKIRAGNIMMGVGIIVCGVLALTYRWLPVWAKLALGAVGLTLVLAGGVLNNSRPVPQTDPAEETAAPAAPQKTQSGKK